MQGVCRLSVVLVVVVQPAIGQLDPSENTWPVRCSHNCRGVNTCRQVCAGQQTQVARCPALEFCPKQDPVKCPDGPSNCEWEAWTTWSAQTTNDNRCTGLCVRGRAIATVNKCGGTACSGPMNQSKTCPTRFMKGCPNRNSIVATPCSLTPWLPWGPCNSPTPNQRNRTRGIQNSPQQGGSCQVYPLSQVEPCGTAARGQNCTVSDWMDWNPCDKTSCGDNGQQIRYRTFTNRAVGGSACISAMSETAPCSTPKCGNPTACSLTAWTEWIVQGSLQKERSRTAILAQNNGTTCAKSSLAEAKPNQSLQINARVDCTFADWQAWGECSKTCGGGQRTRSRSIKQEAKNGGKACSENSPLAEMGRCSMKSCSGVALKDCLLQQWSPWSTCTVSCGKSGQIQRKRSVERPATEGGSPCIGSLVEVRACQAIPSCIAKNCMWNDWGEWSHASATCGRMVLNRTRGIKQNASFDGRECEANEMAEMMIRKTKCPENCIDGKWGQWSAWTACTQSCSGGYRSRFRNVDVVANDCGKLVDGNMSSYELCNRQKCAGLDEDCVLSDWVPWSVCSRTCGGVQNRSRQIHTHRVGHGAFCGNAAGSNNTALFQVRPCNSIPDAPCSITKYADCEFTSWHPWSACSVTCDGGVMTRERAIATKPSLTGDQCEDGVKQSKSCKEDTPCSANTDCQWDSWGEWGACTKCSGQSFRARKIKQLALGGGKPCEVANAQQVKRCAKDCNGTIAKFFCIWSTWDVWSACKPGSDSCGNGIRTRKMTLGATTVPPNEYAALAHTKEDCNGVKIITEPCNVGVCNKKCTPQNCIQGDWGEWQVSDCNGICSRQRPITQKNNECGKPCIGAMNSSKACSAQKGNCSIQDCSLSPWSEWTSCPSSLAQKYHYRSVMHHARHGGKACPKQPTNVTKPCLLGSDVVSCKVSNWGDWDVCDKTCMGGQRKRLRQIVRPASHGGEACSEPLEETQPCNKEKQCSTQDCRLSDWGMWSGCNTLKELQSYRYRTIQNQGAGRPCEGSLEEIHSCVKAVPCDWSEWNEWSTCSRPCNEGHQMRSRSVLTYAIRNGPPCVGAMIVLRACHNNTICTAPRDCVLAPWMPWTACNPACGRGQKERKRTVTVPPSNGGKECPKNLHEVGICESPACTGDVDCKWADWADWDPCVPAAGDCGVGYKRRKRGFISQPVKAGRLCPPRIKEQVAPVPYCQNQSKCCQDAEWGDWGAWSNCSRPCGGGLKLRSRTLDVIASWCGKPANGTNSSTQSCNEFKCDHQDCLLGPWSSWEPPNACPAKCTTNHQSRKRDIQRFASEGAACQGNLHEWRACPGTKCSSDEFVHVKQDCEVTTWSDWSQCSKTCDSGVKDRTRKISKPARFNGKGCPSSLRDHDSCNTQSCGKFPPVKCTWQAWSDWPVACLGEERQATRSFTPAVRGGAACEGVQTKVQACGVCANATFGCGWGLWEDWQPCSATCGTGGTRARIRRLATTPEALLVDKLFDASVPSSAIDTLSKDRAEPQKLEKLNAFSMLGAFGFGTIALVIVFGACSMWRRRAYLSAPIPVYINIASQELLEEGAPAE